MVAILEVPAVRARVSAISVEQYEGMGERTDGRRTELIRGILIEKMTISPLHSFLVEQLRVCFQAALTPGSYCRQEQPLRLIESVPEPDFAVVTGRARDYRRLHPTSALLVAEIAVSSLELDHEKASIYAEAGIPEYWIVLANHSAIEVYTAPVADHYTQRRTYQQSETISSVALPSLCLKVDTLFAD